MLLHRFMHVDNELVQFMPTGEQEYEEELFAQEGAWEPVGTDFANPAPAQGKPWCIIPIFK